MKKAHQSKLSQGSDNPTVSHKTNNGNIPLAVISKLEEELRGICFGGVSLIITCRNGNPTFRIEKIISMMTPAIGSAHE